MTVSGTVNGNAWSVTDDVWADAKSKPVFVGAAAPGANVLLAAVLNAGPAPAYRPAKGDVVQTRRFAAGPTAPWGTTAETVDMVADTYVVTIPASTGELTIRKRAEFEFRAFRA
jgi:hypothetical protein